MSPTKSAKKGARISVGIGSWTDKEYVGVLFPKGVRPEERLAIYATHFDHVEVNSSYHALPRRAWVENWAAVTPAEFRFDFKLPRQFSQSPARYGGDEQWVSRVLETTRPLHEAGKFGAFFLVMSATFGPERHRLEELDALVEKLRPHTLAVELRHRAWVESPAREATLAHFRARKLAWIAVDMPQIAGSTIMPAVDEVTYPRLAYLRLHGRNRGWLEAKSAEERHAYDYEAPALKEIAARVRDLAGKADEVRVVANNHAQDYAPKAALALQRLLKLRKG